MTVTTLDPARPSRAPRGLADAVREIAAHPDRWLPHVRFDPTHRYTRLVTADGYEVWLLTWLPGQGTEIHDHGGSSGAFAVVRGELTERSFAPAGRRSQPTPWALRTGSLRAFGPHHVHEVTNRGADPVISIHGYAPALLSMSYHRHAPEGMLELLRTDRLEEGARR